MVVVVVGGVGEGEFGGSSVEVGEAAGGMGVGGGEGGIVVITGAVTFERGRLR